MKSIKLLIILLLFIGCKSEKEWNKEEVEIVSSYINGKLLIDLVYPTINDRYYEILEKDSTKHYSLDEKLSIIENIEKEVAQEKYYITIDDTLFAVERKTNYFVNEIMSHHFYEKLRDNQNNRTINLKNLKIRKNLILVSSNKGIDSSLYLGKYAISRVLFDKTQTKALLTHKRMNAKNNYLPSMTEFVKKDEQWSIKKKWE